MLLEHELGEIRVEAFAMLTVLQADVETLTADERKWLQLQIEEKNTEFACLKRRLEILTKSSMPSETTLRGTDCEGCCELHKCPDSNGWTLDKMRARRAEGI